MLHLDVATNPVDSQHRYQAVQWIPNDDAVQYMDANSKYTPLQHEEDQVDTSNAQLELRVVTKESSSTPSQLLTDIEELWKDGSDRCSSKGTCGCTPGCKCPFRCPF